MAKITSVEPQKKNPKRFNVFLDGQFAFGADEDLIVEKRLVVGKEISANDIEKILFEAEVGKLMERMYRLFNIRQRSEKEVRNYFRVKNLELRIKVEEPISNMVVELVTQKLKQKGILNDEQFARAWVESRSKKKGKRALKAELIQKGVGREIIEQVLSEQVTGDSEEEVAKKLLEKKMKVWRSLPTAEMKKKAYQFLLRRGFEYEMVKDVVENLIKKM